MNARHLALAGLSLLIPAAPLLAQDAGKKMENPKTEQFMVIEKHNPADCAKNLESVSEKGAAILNRFEWGCKWGNHSGYAVVDATSEAAVREMLPSSMHDVQILRVSKFTQQEIKDLHGKKG